MTLHQPGSQRLERDRRAPTTAGWWSYRVEGWSDPYGTWDHDATIKIAADVDAEMMLEEGARVLERALAEVERTPKQAAVLDDAVTGAARHRSTAAGNRLRAGHRPAVRAGARGPPAARLRQPRPPTTRGWSSASGRCTAPGTSSSPAPRAAVLDPATGLWTVGHLRTAAERLPAVAGMGFDVIYLTPIHPIGTTARKGPNNTLIADETTRAARTRSARPTAGTTPSTPTSARSTTSTPSSPRPRNSASRWRWTSPCSARPTTPRSTTTPGVVHHPRRRHHRVRGEPAEEVPGHLPAELRQRPGGRLRRDAPGHPGLDRPRRQDLPRRQPAHQAGGVLGVAHRRRRPGPPRGHLAGRGVHQAGDDARPGQGRVPAVLHLLRLAQREVGARGVPARSCPATRPPTCARRSGRRRTTSSRRTCSTAARPPGSCGPRWPRPWCRPTASTPATS